MHIYLFMQTELSHIAPCSHTSAWVSAVKCTPQQLWLGAHPDMVTHSGTLQLTLLCTPLQGGRRWASVPARKENPLATSLPLQPQPGPWCVSSLPALPGGTHRAGGVRLWDLTLCSMVLLPTGEKQRVKKENQLCARSSCRPGVGELFLGMSWTYENTTYEP